MPSTASYRPGVLSTNLLMPSGLTRILPPNVVVPPIDWTDCNCAIGCALTPSGTSVTVNPTGTDAITFTNATVTEPFIAIGSTAFAAAKFFILGARRKPGTTGAIAAQTIAFVINSVTLATIKVAAAAAGADPEVGYAILCTPDSAADTRFSIASQDITINVTAADTDLEIFFLMIGTD